MNSSSRTIAVVIAGVLAVVLSSCVLPQSEPYRTAVTFMDQTPGFGDSSYISGTITETNGCLTILTEQGEYILVLNQSEFAPVSNGKFSYADQQFAFGDIVNAMGSSSSNPDVSHIPASCNIDLEFWYAAKLEHKL